MPNALDNNMTACPRCQYSLSGLPEAYACPECGFGYEDDMLALHGWDAQTKPTRTNLAVVLVFIIVLLFLLWRQYYNVGMDWLFFFYLALTVLTVFSMVSILRNLERRSSGETQVRVVVTSNELILFDVPHAARELRWPLHSISSAVWKEKGEGWKVTFHINGQNYGPLDLHAPPAVISSARAMIERAAPPTA
ncbi:MAG: hypothetical protein KC983_00795 [Phycisphaerales bacterium]|nr:hypothetical protein [Phycisphaerales bacterium]